MKKIVNVVTSLAYLRCSRYRRRSVLSLVVNRDWRVARVLLRKITETIHVKLI